MDANFPKLEAELALLEAALADPKQQATIDAVRDKVICPPGCNPKQFGEVITQMRANGLIRKASHANTKRKIARGRGIVVWKIVDVEVARKRVLQLRKLIKNKTGRRVAALGPVQKKLF